MFVGSTAEDCVSGFRALCSEPKDSISPDYLKVKMNEELYLDIISSDSPSTIKVGILQESSHLPYSDAVKRAISLTEEACKKLGFEVVPFFLTDEVWNTARDYIQWLRSNFTNQELFAELEESCEKVLEPLNTDIDRFKRSFALAIASQWKHKAMGKHRQARNEKLIYKNDNSQQAVRRIEHFKSEISKKWQLKNLTVLLSPVFPSAVFKREDSHTMDQMFEYCGIWNLLGYPCSVFPVTKVHSYEQFFKDHYNDEWTRILQRNAKDSEGLPVGLQFIGFPNEDEKLLAVLKLVEQEMKIKVRAARLSEESQGHYLVKSPRVTVVPLQDLKDYKTAADEEKKSLIDNASQSSEAIL